MYYGRWSNPQVPAPRPADRIADHVGSAEDFVDRVRSAVESAVARDDATDIAPYLFGWSADVRLLRQAWELCAGTKGQAPGPDGLRFDDVDAADAWRLLRAVAKAIASGTYRAGALRTVKILKDVLRPERGVRRLSVPNIVDRVVQTSILTVIGPLVDRVLDDDVFGFRPGRDRLHALARAQRLVGDGRTVCVAEDLRDAFDSVPRGRLRDVVEAAIPDERLVDLILEACGPGRRGLPQGAPLSPSLLNLYLAHHLDRPWRAAHADIPLLRFADDLLLLCRSRREALGARRDLAELLRPTGMRLKGMPATTVCDLRSDPVDWLGWRIGLTQDRFSVRIAERAWSRLADALRQAHAVPDSPLVAEAAVRGWLDQLGPCYGHERTGRVLDRMLRLAGDASFRELPSRDALRQVWRRSRERSRAILEPPPPVAEIRAT